MDNPKIEGDGWLEDIRRCVACVDGPEFYLEDIYRFEKQLAAAYPENQHVRDKIRQQLQFLRDRGELEFVDDRGTYRRK